VSIELLVAIEFGNEVEGAFVIAFVSGAAGELPKERLKRRRLGKSFLE